MYKSIHRSKRIAESKYSSVCYENRNRYLELFENAKAKGERMQLLSNKIYDNSDFYFRPLINANCLPETNFYERLENGKARIEERKKL